MDGSEEDIVSDRIQVVLASVAGAVIGGVAGYLFLTPRGRQVWQRLEPALEEAARELSRVTGTVVGAAGAAREGWKVVRNAIERADFNRYPNSSQHSPF